jgi:type IV pilus assembly protein PilB
MKKKRIGDVLLESGQISEQDLNRALAIQKDKKMRLGEALLQTQVAKADIAKAVEEVQGVTFVECPERVSKEVLALVPRAIAVRCCALPLELNDRTLTVAFADPQNLAHLDELRFCSGKMIAPRFAFKEDLVAAIKKFYPEDKEEGGRKNSKRGPAEVEFDQANFGDVGVGDVEFITTSTQEDSYAEKKEIQAGMRQRTVAVRIVSMILAKAAQKGASDVHIEPQIKGTIVRLRIDGILREFLTIPTEHQSSVASRIKILADMDIAERRVPQDGRFLMLFRERRLDVRVSSLPTHFGEKVVMRILDPHSTLSTFDQLGFSPHYTDVMKRLLSRPEGMIIVTGPTGSGKSTTLYVALNHLRSPTRNIITAEDPVEYMLEGVNQIQVHPKAGLTFASCLPSILRQDPDVIMVGEIRDAETAEIALRASQTGHLVLSTLHTNDSISAITRLLDLGIPKYLIGAVHGIVGQRLLRKLCDCRKVVAASLAYQEKIAGIGVPGKVMEMFQPVGCPACEHTGYKGRIGVYELLLVDEQVREAIDAEARPDEIRQILRGSGFRTMQESAFVKLKQGQTTLEEVLRVLSTNASSPSLQCSRCSRELGPSFVFCPFCGVGLSGSFAELEDYRTK